MNRIFLSGTIDKYYEISAKSVRAQIDAIQNKRESLEVVLNSPGGSIFEGLEIYHMIKSYPGESIVTVAGVAASMGSIVMLAGKKVQIAKGSTVMIHNPLTWLYGNANDMRETAEDLDSIRDSLLEIYLDKTKMSKEELIKMLDRETYLSAQEAFEKGFVDEVVDTYGEQNLSYGFAAMGNEESIKAHILKMKTMLKPEDFKSFRNQKPNEENMKITLEDVLAHAPSVADHFRNEGRSSFDMKAIEEKHKAELDSAVKAEAARILAIQNSTVPGLEAEAKTAIENGTSLADFALSILPKLKNNGAEMLKTLQANSDKIKVNAEEITTETVSDFQAALNTLESLKPKKQG